MCTGTEIEDTSFGDGGIEVQKGSDTFSHPDRLRPHNGQFCPFKSKCDESPSSSTKKTMLDLSRSVVAESVG